MQGFPVVATAGGYSLTWCHWLLVLVVQRHHFSWSCSIFLTVSQATQGRQSRRESKKDGTQVLEEMPESAYMKIDATPVQSPLMPFRVSG